MATFIYLLALSVLTSVILFTDKISCGTCDTQPTVNNVCYVEKKEVITVEEFQLCACPTTESPPEVNTPSSSNGRRKRDTPWGCMCRVWVNKTEITCKPECCKGFVYNENAICVREVVITSTARPVLYEAPRFRNCPSLASETIVKVPSHLNYAIFTHEMLNLTAVDYVGNKLDVYYSETRFQATVPSMNTHQIVAHSGVDSLGNKAICLFYINVRDEHPPVFTRCPVNFERETGETVTWKLPTATDNVRLKKDPVLEIGPQRGTTTLKPGLYFVIYKVEDLEGNQATCDFTINIKEKTKTEYTTTTTPIPYKRPRFINCPKQAQTYEDADSVGLYRLNITLTVKDYLGKELNVTFTNTEFEHTDDPKNYTVVASSEPDRRGEVVQCVFYVSIPGKPTPPEPEKQTDPIWPMIVGGILGFLLLIIIILGIAYLCKHSKHRRSDPYTDLDFPVEDPPAYREHPDDDYQNPDDIANAVAFTNPSYPTEPPLEASGVNLPEREDSQKYVSIVDVGIDYPEKKVDIDPEYDNAVGAQVSDVDIDFETAKFKKG